jgi:hypothetical protein
MLDSHLIITKGKRDICILFREWLRRTTNSIQIQKMNSVANLVNLGLGSKGIFIKYNNT